MIAGLLQAPAAHAVEWALIHFLWEGAVIAALLAAALFLLRPASSRVRYGLACAALAATVLAFAATLAVLWPGVHLDPGVVIRNAVPPLAHPPVLPAGGATPTFAADHLRWIVPVWLAGVLVFYLRSAGFWLAARRLRRKGVILASAEWQNRLRALAERLRLARPVILLESCLAETPAVVGYLRPAVLVPAGLLMGLPPDQLEAILLHELAHIRRHDYALNVLQSLVEGLLFYHPAVWWISGVVRAERENCCDDAVVAAVGDPRGYAAALAALEQMRSAPQPALAAKGGNLMRRIRRLLEPESPRSIAGPIIGAGLLLGSVAAGLLAWQPATAQESPTPRTEIPMPYSKWLIEDVVYIIMPEERDAFKRLQTDAEREQFIEQFWLKRDPTPGTPQNEFKEEHYRRVAYANEHFAESIPGWKTHRGMYYVKFGPPDQIDDHRNSRPAFQAWTYNYFEPAPGVQGSPATVVFTDLDGAGQFTLPRHNTANATIMGTPPRVEVSNQAARVTFNIPSIGGPTVVYVRISSRAGEAVTSTEDTAAPPYYARSFNLQPGVYRMQIFVQRPGESVIALFPRGEQFEVR